MRRLLPAAAMAAMVLVTTIATAQDRPSSETPAKTGIVTEVGGTGALKARGEVDPTLPTHTIYRPVDLPKTPLPLVVWANGACRDNGLSYSYFLREIASHGYLVVSLGYAREERPIRPPQAQPEQPPPPPSPGPAPTGPNRGDDETTFTQMIEAIDWATRATQAKTGPWSGRIDVSRIAVMGHSCGGLQTIAAAEDKRVTTAMVWNSGIYTRPGGRSGIRLEKSQLAKLHGPVAYVTGGPSDIAYVNAVDDFTRIEGIPALIAHLPVGHGGTYAHDANGGAYAPVAVDWLDWQLKGDAKAAKTFTGPDCGLCVRPGWTVERKGIK